MPRAKRDQMPDTLWVMGYHTYSALGAVCHVTSGDRLHLTEADCQRQIDTMQGWIGMGSRDRYRPIPLKFRD